MFQCCCCIIVVQRICGQSAGGKGRGKKGRERRGEERREREERDKRGCTDGTRVLGLWRVVAVWSCRVKEG
jgi:hypothetical protein